MDDNNSVAASEPADDSGSLYQGKIFKTDQEALDFITSWSNRNFSPLAKVKNFFSTSINIFGQRCI